MRQLALVGLMALATAACQDATAPRDAVSLRRGLTANLGGSGGSFSTNAVLSSDLVVEGSPITYLVDFGFGFSSISEVDYDFTFGDDPLDFGECLTFGAGFCNPGTTPQTSRLLTILCSGDPGTCDAFRDGVNAGEVAASRFAGSGVASVRITSLTVTVQGTVATPPEQVQRIVDQVDLLRTSGTLGQGQANSLTQKLRRAIALLNAGKTTPAGSILNAFINAVTALMSGSKPVLTPGQGQPLIDAANAVIAGL